MLHILRSGFEQLWRRPSSQIPALDAIRATAILLVIGGHYVKEMWRAGGGPSLRIEHFAAFEYGWTGVDLFFILSGFLIGRQLWKELLGTGDVQVWRFVMRRGFRIWPLYFAFLLIILLVRPGHDFRWPDWVFLSNYLPGALAGGWSLSTEEQFYISVPLLLVLFKNRPGPGQWLLILLGLLGLELVARSMTITSLREQGVDERAIRNMANLRFHLHCDALLIGLMIALVSTVRPAWFKRPADSGFSMAGFGILAASCVVAAVLYRANEDVFNLLAIGLVFGGFTVWALLDRSLLSRPLASRTFYPISRLSYGMYLNHLMFMPALSVVLIPLLVERLGAGFLAFGVGLVTCVVLSMLLATITFVVIEHPFLHLREQWLARRRLRAPSLAS